jgi:isochorismate synthase
MQRTGEVSTHSDIHIDSIASLLRYAVSNQFAIALWRLPNQSEVHLSLSRKTQFVSRDASIETLPSGFIFSPFDRAKESIFLPADFKFSFKNKVLLPPSNALESLSQAWLVEHFQHVAIDPHAPLYHAQQFDHSETVSYESLVQKSVDAIAQGKFEKVVPSHKKLVNLPHDFELLEAFQNICNANPDALVSIVSSVETGTWMGATPEILISVLDNTIFKTVALAGTQPYDGVTDIKDVTWTQKEIEEQALVERYIISCFKKVRVREYDEFGPKTIVAGNLLHLKSDFVVDMKAINFPQLGSVMLQLLHPTSAVCGMPLEPALDFLKNHEGYDRTYYAGYLGPVNLDSAIHLFVNIRCMQIADTKAAVFAGAGVTIDSIPEKEKKETEFKFNTLLRTIFP